jgi:hypothetical protein
LKGRLVEGGAGKGMVNKEVGEDRDDGVKLRGAGGAGKNHVEFVTEGVGGQVGDVPAGGWGEELVGREGAALAS